MRPNAYAWAWVASGVLASILSLSMLLGLTPGAPPLVSLRLGLSGQAPLDEAQRLKSEASLAFNNGLYKEAEVKYQAALRADEASGNMAGAALSLFGLAQAYRLMGQPDPALTYLERALQQYENLNDRKGVALSLLELARLEIIRRNYDRSLQISGQALARFEALDDPPGIADSLHSMALAYKERRMPEEALKYGLRSLKLGEALNDQRRLAFIHRTLGDIEIDRNDPASAMEHHRKASHLFDAVGERHASALSAFGLGRLHYRLGDFGEALDYIAKAARLFEEYKDSYGLADAWNGMGVVQARVGDFPASLQAFQKAFKLREQLGDDRRFQVLMNIGNVYGEQARYSEALAQYYLTLARAEAAADGQAMMLNLSNIAIMNTRIGRHGVAVEYLRRALEVAEKLNDGHVIARQHQALGEAHNNLGRHTEALDYYERARALSERLGDKAGLATSSGEIGFTYTRLKRYDEALDHYRKTIPQLRALGAQRDLAVGLCRMGYAYHQQKNWPEAEAALSEAIEISQRIGDPECAWEALYGKALVLRDRGRVDAAIDLIKEAIRALESVRGGIQSTGARATFLHSRVGPYGHLVQWLADRKDYKGAFHYAERAKARSLLELLTEARSDIRKKIDPALLERERLALARWLHFQGQYQAAAARPFPSPEGPALDALRGPLARAERDYEQVALDIRRRSPEYAAVKYPEPVRLEDAQRLLDDQTVLLSYMLSKDRSVLFAVTRAEVRLFQLPPAADLERRVAALLRSLEEAPNPSSTAGYRREALALYEQLVQPAEPLLRGKRTLLISPDGAAALVPFAALLRNRVSAAQPPAAWPYLVRDFNVRSIPSASVMTTLRQPERKDAWSKTLVAFAPVTFENPAAPAGGDTAEAAALAQLYRGGVALRNLPFTQEELDGIGGLYDRAQVSLYTGPAATEERVKAGALKGYRYAHFATHGVLRTDRPEFSAVLLRPGGSEDGYLRLAEVFNLELDAQLVVLSACQTAKGQRMNGEGLIGLTRGFLYAGAGSVLASLWDVRDRPTAHFMREFYKNLDGASPAQALRRTQLALIQGRRPGNAPYNHPYYWSAFVLTGE